MRVDATRHDITARRIQHGVARQVGPDLDDHAPLDLDVGLVGQIGGDDRAALDDCGGHVVSPRLVVLMVARSVRVCPLSMPVVPALQPSLAAPPHPALRATFSPLGRRSHADVVRPDLLSGRCGEVSEYWGPTRRTRTSSSPQRGEGGPKGRMRGREAKAEKA
jgi:hypothetical protein